MTIFFEILTNSFVGEPVDEDIEEQEKASEITNDLYALVISTKRF